MMTAFRIGMRILRLIVPIFITLTPAMALAGRVSRKAMTGQSGAASRQVALSIIVQIMDSISPRV